MRIFDYKFFVLDFDGVFTDNKVYCDSSGNEFVRCCKYDSMALSIIKRHVLKNDIDFQFFILSSEKNEVVSKRAKKLDLKVYQGIENKFKFLQELNNNLNSDENFKNLIFLGNDLNDLESMKAAAFSACPKDAPSIIRKNSDFVGNNNGGNGFIREVLEYLIRPLNLDNIN